MLSRSAAPLFRSSAALSLKRSRTGLDVSALIRPFSAVASHSHFASAFRLRVFSPISAQLQSFSGAAAAAPSEFRDESQATATLVRFRKSAHFKASANENQKQDNDSCQEDFALLTVAHVCGNNPLTRVEIDVSSFNQSSQTPNGALKAHMRKSYRRRGRFTRPTQLFALHRPIVSRVLVCDRNRDLALLECPLELKLLVRKRIEQQSHETSSVAEIELSINPSDCDFPRLGDAITSHGFVKDQTSCHAIAFPGTLSRIATVRYEYSHRTLLALCSRNMRFSPGASGGPVFESESGRFVGIAMQRRMKKSKQSNVEQQEANQTNSVDSRSIYKFDATLEHAECQVIPLPLIRHFLRAALSRPLIEPHLVTLGIQCRPRMHLIGSATETGIIVTSVSPNSSLAGKVSPGDILAHLNSHSIACDGTVALSPNRCNERIAIDHLVSLLSSTDCVTVRICRSSAQFEFSTRLACLPSAFHSSSPHI